MRVYLLILFLLTTAIATSAEPVLEQIWEKEYEELEIVDAKFSVDGDFVFAAFRKTIKKLSVENGEILSVFDNSIIEEEYKHGDLKISKSGKYLVTTTGGGTAILWDTEQEKAIKYIKNNARSADITIDEKQLIIATHNDVSKIVIYDLEKDEEVMSIQTTEYNDLIKLSNDGILLAVSGTRKDDIDPNKKICFLSILNYHDLSFVKKVFEEEKSNGLRKLEFSANDGYIISVLRSSYDARIFRKGDYEMVYKSNINKFCMNLIFLNDDNHFMVLYGDPNGNTELELRNFSDYIKSFDIVPSVADVKKINGRTYLYYRSGYYNRKSYLFDVDLLNTVAEESENPFNVQYGNKQILINFNEIDNAEYKIEIFNISGTLVFSHNDSVPEFSKRLDLPLGAFICKITIGDKTYSQKFIAGGK